MPKRTPLDQLNCSLARALSIVGDGWTMLILRDLFLGATRFGDLAKSLPIARNILSDRLDRLVKAGLVERQEGKRPSYTLTEKGQGLVPALAALIQWGDRWLSDAPPMRITDALGRPIAPVTIEDVDGRQLGPSDVTVLPGPGATPETRAYIRFLRTR